MESGLKFSSLFTSLLTLFLPYKSMTTTLFEKMGIPFIILLYTSHQRTFNVEISLTVYCFCKQNSRCNIFFT